jgi:pyridoxamine 5'-phosphate oxidase
MNQKNGKNSLGIDSCFEDLDNPIELFKKWFAKAEKSEINDPNAVAVATASKENQPNVRMVLLKGLSNKGFVFYTNFNSKKGGELKENQKASMCFHWKSLRRQVRSNWKSRGSFKKEADDYYNSRPL